MMWPTMLMSSLDGQGSVLSSRKLLHRLCDEQVASHHRVSIHSHETSSSTFHITKKWVKKQTGFVGDRATIFSCETHIHYWLVASRFFVLRCEFVLLKTKTLMVESCQFHSSWWSHHHFWWSQVAQWCSIPFFLWWNNLLLLVKSTFPLCRACGPGLWGAV